MIASQKTGTLAPSREALVILTGNPNCGKTTLFNALTGLRAKVGNYAGVTVERKEGRMLQSHGQKITVLDLPGTYSLSPQSLDEEIARDVLLQRIKEVPPPDLVIVVVDASNLQRNLYYATQVLELGHPTILALNMVDVAEANGAAVDCEQLAKVLGIPVIPLVASRGKGLPDLREAIFEMVQRPGSPAPRLHNELPPGVHEELEAILKEFSGKGAAISKPSALLLLTDERAPLPKGVSGSWASDLIQSARQRLEAQGIDWRSVSIEGRYAAVGRMVSVSIKENDSNALTFSDKLDAIVTHKFWGMLIFVGIMALMFQAIFTLARVPMDLIQSAVDLLAVKVASAMPPGDLQSLISDGIIAGVGAVIVFLPQICLLFLFIGLLEDTGYMARAAFLMDRLMSKVGLHGKSFIPMLSSFACAIPGIMATRTIESPKDRLATILVAPLMSCSARLPVYTLLIAACIPEFKVFGFFRLSGLTMLVMYLLGIFVALFMAWIFKRTLLRGDPPLLIMELPPYKKPVFKVVVRHMWDRSQLFLKRAGTVILAISIFLWFLASYPKYHPPAPSEAQVGNTVLTANSVAGEQLRTSYAGRLGRFIEPAIAPLGFDWKIGIGIVASFAAREVFVSTMSTVYNVEQGDKSPESRANLALVLRQQLRKDGSALFTPLLAVTLMVFYVFALQCVSTVAIVRRETNGWKWPIFQWLYMGALAWGLAFITWHGGRWLGFN